MNIAFDEIGQTIAIGALFFVSICLLFRHFTGMIEIFQQISNLKLPALFTTAVLLAFLYSVGILAQSISKNSIANRKPNLDFLYTFLEDDQVMRKRSLDYFKKRATEADIVALKSIKKAIGTDTVNSIFFFCKNRVFNDPKFYPELKSIENKLFFATSLTFVAWFMLIVYIFSLLLFFVFHKFKRKTIQDTTFGKKYRYELFYLLVLIFLLEAGSVSYKSLQDSLNLRIFGYYTSSWFDKQLDEAKDEKIKID